MRDIMNEMQAALDEKNWALVTLFVSNSYRINPNANYKGYKTALFYAAEAGNKVVTKYLIDQGGFTNHSDINDVSPLMAAASGGHLDVVKCLVEHRAQLKLKDLQGKTALMYATEGGHVEVVKYLEKALAGSPYY